MPTTSNLFLTQQAYNSTSPTWDQPLNYNDTIMDAVLSSTTLISMPTGISTTTTVPSPAATIPVGGSTQAMRIRLQNALSANQTLAFPVGISGRWIVTNDCTGTQTVALKVSGGALSVNAPQGYSIGVFSNGVELYQDNDGIIQNLSTTTLNVANLVASGSVSDGIGNVRTITTNTKSTPYTLIASDSGKSIIVTAAVAITIPSAIFSAGQAITILNTSGSTINITQGGGLSLILAGLGSTGNRTLSNAGIATVFYTAAGTAYISGSGVS